MPGLSPFGRFCLPWILAAVFAGAQGQGNARLFPLEPYQRLATPWLEAGSDQKLFTTAFQTRKAEEFRKHFLSPWDPGFLTGHRLAEVETMQEKVLRNIRGDLAEGTGFGPNLRPYGPDWLARIAARLPPARHHPRERAVTLDNTLVRLLPTMDLYMQHPDQPGQGYPFDNLQNSALWAGTPVRILDRTLDQAWCLVLAPDCAGWVRAETLARAGTGFVRRWRRAARRNGLAAALATEAPVRDAAGRFRFLAYVGSVFPRGAGRAILIPERSPGTGRALSRRAFLPAGAAAPQPWPYTPAHAALLWRSLLGRPYGWGNTQFRNDCSAELKAFFTPFGLWLPRHSANQKESGRAVDLSGLALPERLAALARIGRPYRSIVWFQGHVMLFLGPLDYTAPDGARATGFMTYQNLWGLRPTAPPDYRAIVGGSVLFPVLDRYPQQPELGSLAGRSHFVVTRLDQDPGTESDPFEELPDPAEEE